MRWWVREKVCREREREGRWGRAGEVSMVEGVLWWEGTKFG